VLWHLSWSAILATDIFRQGIERKSFEEVPLFASAYIF